MKLRTILLAEDNPNDVELTLRALEDLHLANNVHVVRDGVEVMDYLRCTGKYVDRNREMPAVILLDLKMPRMNGIEVLREIKNDASLKIVPVVMLTSSREDSDLLACYTLGVNAYVVKPVDFSQIVDVVRQVGGFWAIINELPAF
jgi:CheY-like chemotaxis protein